MDWAAALELVIARTRHLRYRELCADTHPDHPAWRRRVVAMATGEPEAPRSLPSDRPSVSESWDLTRAMHACAFRSVEPGCCAGARCALRKWALVSFHDCHECLKVYG